MARKAFGSQAEYARHAGISEPAVSKLKRNGRLVLTSDGRVDFAATDDARRRGADPSRALAGTAPEIPAPVSREPADPPTTPLQAPMTFAEVKAEDAWYSARLKQIDLETQLGNILLKDAVAEAEMTAARTVRMSIDSLPGHAEEIVAAATSGGADAVRGVLRTIARRIEESLASQLTAMAEEADATSPPDGDADGQAVPPTTTA